MKNIFPLFLTLNLLTALPIIAMDETPTDPSQYCEVFKKMILEHAEAKKQSQTLKGLALRASLPKLKDYLVHDNATALTEFFKAGLDLDYTIDPNAEEKLPLLAFSASQGALKCLTLLLSKKASIDKQDNFGNTALSHAARCGKIECLEKLLEAGAQVDIQNRYGKLTAAMIAIFFGQIPCVKALIKANTNLTLTNSLDETPLRIAQSWGRSECAELVREKLAQK